MEGGAVFMTMEDAMEEWLARKPASRRRQQARLSRYDHSAGRLAVQADHRATRIARQIVTILPMA